MENKEFDSIKIGLASPDQIRAWSYGEVTKPETINYRTLKPERDGLYCERIFGPTKDWECHCGKYKRIRYKGKICDKCGVEVTRAKVRRERMGHIELAAPVSHIWYFKGIPSRIGLMLDISPRQLDKVLYFANYIVTDPGFTPLEKKQLLTEREYKEMREKYEDTFEAGMGAEAIQKLLAEIDLDKLSKELREELEHANGQKRVRLLKRLECVESFLESNQRPEWMIMTVIPVIPPDLRPLLQLDGGRFATSDLNDLYRRVINRNNRLKRLLDLGAPEIIVNNEKRMLQEAVDSLFDNGRRGRPVTGPGNRPLKSLSDMLKGKQGRFRQNLLGKRVDYSGRSVIVVGPTLKLHQCGLPQQMALELFKPFVMKRLVELEYAANIKAAKRAVDRCASYVWDVLEEVIVDHPVLLNRAPTLHRLGIQAFEPVLVEGKAIKLHPLVCTAFNADFDGDQMAVHVPLGNEAQAEARVLMLSANNIKSPAHGRPLTIPTQDMIIGMYFLTTVRDGFPGEGRVFASVKDALDEFEAGTGVDIQARISVRATRDMQIAKSFSDFETVKAGERFETSIGRIIFNNVLPEDHQFVNYVVNKKEIGRLIEECSNRYDVSDMPAILDGLKNAGYHYATKAGITVSVFDATMPPNKAELLAAADAKVDAIDEDYEMGLMSPEERHKQVVDIWNDTTEEIGEAMAANFDQYNPIYMMADSGARGNIKQIRQLAGMRGLMGNTKGGTIDRPVKSNFREGLSVLEYFISTHGTRKGMTDTALRTADSGYLTRRLVDVAQDVIVREIDCGTPEGVPYPLHNEKGEIDENLIGRCLLEDTGDLLAGDYITSMDQLKAFEAAGIDTVVIRTVMTCHAEHGVCQKCYGWDLATGRPVNIGTAVGIIAAQSIGEPGTQLTMRTFHAGGVAGDDITHGLPRVTELFEARKPKGQAVLAEIAGTLQITGDKTTKTLTVHDTEGNFREYVVSARAQMLPGIIDGCAVKVGQQLTKGSVNPHDLLRLTDPNTTLRYIVAQVQDVYVSQGVDINDKHIEVIARQMLRKVVVMEAGDSELLPGRQVNRHEFERVANELIAEGKQPPVGQPLLLGITKASLATDSFLSAASFQETTKVLTDAAIEGKTDVLAGLKENVIIGKPIPAGTGLPRYHKVGLTYKGAPVHPEGEEQLPDYAPRELREIEDLLPQPQDWSLDENYMGGYGNYFGGGSFRGGRANQLSDEDARLYLYDDLGVSQRWANKFSEAGIETVGDLVGYTEDELLRIEGIGAKAIEELKTGLAEHSLSYLIEDDLAASNDDMSQLLDMVFSPDDTVLIGGDSPATFNTEGEEMLGEALPPRSYHRDLSELDALLGGLGDLGFGETSEKHEAESDEDEE